MNSWLTRISGGLLALALVAGGTGIVRADVIVVSVQSNVFVPSDVTIATGDTIHWTWDQGVHTSTSVDGLWDSGIIGPGSTFDYTFDQAGDYNYYCTLHLECCNMVGTVHVMDPVQLSGTLFPPDPASAATGQAADEMRPYRTTLSVGVANVTTTTSVDVFVNGSFIGNIVLDGSGNGELDLNTNNGDMVPTLQDGDEIEVYDAADDTTLIVIGNVSAGG
jgi:plastocyanin